LPFRVICPRARAPRGLCVAPPACQVPSRVNANRN